MFIFAASVGREQLQYRSESERDTDSGEEQRRGEEWRTLQMFRGDLFSGSEERGGEERQGE